MLDIKIQIFNGVFQGADYVGELTRVWLVSGSVTWLDSLVKSLLTAMSQLPEVRQPGKAG